jgi:hypothetical protein
MTTLDKHNSLEEWDKVDTSLANLFGVPNDKIHKILNTKQNHKTKPVISASLIH